jgi:hypothetical protein
MPFSETMLLTLFSSSAICGSCSGSVTTITSSDRYSVLILAPSFNRAQSS